MKIGISALNLKSYTSSNRTGLEWHAVRAIPALILASEGQHEFEVYLEESTPIPDEWVLAGIADRVRYLPSIGRKLLRIRRFLSLDRTLRARKLDRHFCLYSTPTFRPRIPTIYMIHDIFPITHTKLCHPVAAKREPFFLRQGCRHADRIITISEYSKQQIQDHLGVQKPRIHVIPNGTGNPLVRRSSELVADSYILTVSTVEPRKNLARLIESIEFLCASDAILRLQLKVVGATGWGMDEALEKVKSSRIGKQVEFLGYVPREEMQALYEGASVFVFPSLMEGFGMPVLEAMIVGVPIAASNSTSIPEVAAELAFYFDPYSVESIALAIRRSIDASDRQTRVQAGWERSKAFTWEAAGKAMLEVCEMA